MEPATTPGMIAAEAEEPFTTPTTSGPDRICHFRRGEPLGFAALCFHSEPAPVLPRLTAAFQISNFVPVIGRGHSGEPLHTVDSDLRLTASSLLLFDAALAVAGQNLTIQQ